MTTETLRHLKIIGLHNDKERVLDFLHTLGVLHIKTHEEKENPHALTKDAPVEKQSLIAENLLELKWLADTLEPYVKKVKVVKSFADISLSDLLSDVRLIKDKIHTKVASSARNMAENEDVIKETTKHIELLKAIPFTVTAASLGQKNVTFTTLLELPLAKKKAINFEKTFETNFFSTDSDRPSALEFGPYTIVQKGTFCIVQALNTHKQEFDRWCKEQGCKEISLEACNGHNTKEAVTELTALVEKRKAEQASHKKLLAVVAKNYYKKIRELEHQLGVYHKRYDVTSEFFATKKTFVLDAYVPVMYFDDVKALANDMTVYVSAADIDKADFEKTPSKMRNTTYVRHFEFITKMFGYPKYKTIDPTVFIALFLPFFFGFMFSDIGYGIILALLAGFMFTKKREDMPVILDASIVLGVCALTTIIFGFLFGSFFGNLFGLTPILFDPFSNAKLILISALAIGLFHLNLGLILAAIELLKEGKVKDVIVSQCSVFLLQAGVALLAINASSLGWILLMTSVVLFILKNSLMGLMDITGFVGTWFSYARLLALSLATGGIALGVNIMAEQLNAVSLLGPVLFILVLVFGHLFNFVINIIGSSIHSVRLHYIEFFAQFYEAGGKEYIAYTTKEQQDTL